MTSGRAATSSHMRTIAVEEHCLTPELRELLGPQIHPYYPVHRWPPALEARLLDIGEGRIEEMDAHGIDVQVLSMVQPGLEHSGAQQAVPVARAFNDRLADAIAHGNAERLLGLGSGA